MTSEDYKASRYDWSKADTEALEGDPAFRCLLELRARVEALEEAQRPTVKESSATAPAGSLVERVARLLAEKDDPHEMWHIDARDALREVAAAVRAKDSKHWDPSGVAQMVTWEMVAQWLEQEAGQ
jgi:hypothetical protein